MSIRTKGEPKPWPAARSYRPVAWPVLRKRQLPVIVPPVQRSFVRIVEGRRSTRAIEPVPLKEVLNFIAFAHRSREELVGDPLGRTRRPAISAGALHAIHLIVVSNASQVFRYDGTEHSLELLGIRNPLALKRFVAQASSVLPEASGSYLVLIADTAKSSAVYKHSTSLIWRDAGALLQTLNLCASAYGLAFCAMGMLGHDLLSAIFANRRRLVAVGVASIGRPKPSQQATLRGRRPPS